MKHKRNHKEAGITLVALAVTIIVLLILAGVTINQALGDNGIIEKAQEASDIYANVSEDEMTARNQLRDKISSLRRSRDSGGGSETVGSDAGEANNNNNNNSSITPAPTGSTYTEGQEVTLGNEQFFVLSDNGTELKLLAKYCLNRAGTAQTDRNATYNGSGDAGYGRRFSRSYYWGNAYDLQSSASIEKANSDGYTDGNGVKHEGYAAEGIPNAVLAAQAYGTAKGATGRLMTQAEAKEAGLSTSSISTENMTKIQRIIFGQWTAEDIGKSTTDAPTSGYLNFWLGSSYNRQVWYVVRQPQELYLRLL